MRLQATRASLRHIPAGYQLVPVWGPEPIGAATARSLQGQLNLAGQSQSGQRVGWGENGSVETTNQSVIAPLQNFLGGAGGPLAQAHALTPSPLPGLPATSVPPGLRPFGLGNWWAQLRAAVRVAT